VNPTDPDFVVPPSPPSAPSRQDRGISPIAGRLSGSRSRWITLAALAIGCGAFLAATWDRGDRANADGEIADAGPARQLVPFEPARQRAGPPLLDDDFDPDAPFLGGGGASDYPTAEPRASDRDRPSELETRAELQDRAQRAPLLAWRRSGQAATPTSGSPAPRGSGSDVAQSLSDLDSLRQSSAITVSRAGRLGDRNLMLTAGSIIPCVLQTAMDTNTPGYVSCMIPVAVYSENGAVVLLERGTRVLGEYNGGLKPGSKRLFVLWTRAVTPSGVAINLGSPATDPLGRAGFDGRIDTHFWERFGGTLLLSLVDETVEQARDEAAERGLVQRRSDSASVALEGSRDIPPTLRKDQGAEVSIFVAQDLDFSSVYQLRGRP